MAAAATAQNPVKVALVKRSSRNRAGHQANPASHTDSSVLAGATTGCCGRNGRSLELVSKESFQQRLNGMSSCLDCMTGKHPSNGARFDTQKGSSHRSQKANRVKRNSPIVVCLRDSIRLAAAAAGGGGGGCGGGKLRSKASVAVTNISEEVATTAAVAKTDGRDIGSKHVNYLTTSGTMAASTGSVAAAAAATTLQAKTARGSKNFNAFLSAIEKVHTKDQRPNLSTQNLDHFSSSSSVFACPHASSAGSRTAAEASEEPAPLNETVLNNLAIVNQLESTSTDAARTAFTEKHNVDIICNDLRASGPSASSSSFSSISPPCSHIEMFEESDLSETSSQHSGSDSSENEAETLPRRAAAGDEEEEEQEEEEEGNLSREELDQLSGYANGFAMKRYELPPSECPECLSACFAYTHYYAQGSKYFKIEVLDRDKQNYATPDSMPDSVFDFPSSPGFPPSTTDAKGTFKVNNIGGHSSHLSSQQHQQQQKQQQQQPFQPFLFHRHIDTVSLDLTGSDVTFTVEQHTVETGGSTNQGIPADQAALHPEFYHNFYCTMFGFIPCIPGYCFIPTVYFMFPMWSISKPPTPPATARMTHRHPKPKSQHHLNRDFIASEAAFSSCRLNQPSPPQRPWITLNQPENSQPTAIYTVMCYNVLCDKYATRQLYGYCPSWALNWEFRKKSIFEEIQQYGADIINLQEVETEQFYKFFLPGLKAHGYEGIFSPKSRARTMTEAERKHVDGCAIFFKHSKFSLVEEHLVEFNQVAIETAEGSQDMINRVMTKDNIGLAALLETKESAWENDLSSEVSESPRQLLLVATCHIHWDPECCDVKLIQTMMLMNKLKNIMEESQASLWQGTSTSSSSSSSPIDCNSIPLILCGDLNSLPDSGVVEYLSLGRISANHRDFKEIGCEDSLRKLSSTGNKDNAYSHSFHLSQAYDNDVMPYTNYTSDFKGTIDYVFYSCDFIRPLGILGPPDQEWFRQNHIIGCPNPQIPSDHLPLLVEFEMRHPSPAVPPADQPVRSSSTTPFPATISIVDSPENNSSAAETVLEEDHSPGSLDLTTFNGVGLISSPL